MIKGYVILFYFMLQPIKCDHMAQKQGWDFKTKMLNINCSFKKDYNPTCALCIAHY
jgi:hypothetical protein